MTAAKAAAEADIDDSIKLPSTSAASIPQIVDFSCLLLFLAVFRQNGGFGELGDC